MGHKISTNFQLFNSFLRSTPQKDPEFPSKDNHPNNVNNNLKTKESKDLMKIQYSNI